MVPEGLDLSLIPDDVLRVYRLAIDPPDTAAAPSRKPKPRGSAVGGVRRVVLPANVRKIS